METELEKVKNDYAIELGFESWDHMFYEEGYEIGDHGIDEIAKRYSKLFIH